MTAATLVLGFVIVISLQRRPLGLGASNNGIQTVRSGPILASAPPVKIAKPKPKGENIQIPAKRVVKRAA